jgi:hypothetical protein
VVSELHLKVHVVVTDSLCGMCSFISSNDRRQTWTYVVQLKAGMAYPLSLACFKSLSRLSPQTTPGGTMSLREDMINDG